MNRYQIKAVSMDGVEFLDWKTDASTSQNAVWNFLRMLEDTLGPDYGINGDVDIQVRQIEEMVATRSKWPRPA